MAECKVETQRVAMPAIDESFNALDESTFRKLYFADLVSRSGDSLNFMARIWLAVSVSGSSIFLTLMFVAHSLPEVFFVTTAGRLSDRYRDQRHRILGLSYWVRAPAAFAMGLLALRVDRWTLFDKGALLL
jgi:hypothetical protein